MKSREIAEAIATRLLTTGFGERAERLVLVSREGRDLGGWCRQAIVNQIKDALAEWERLTGRAKEPKP